MLQLLESAARLAGETVRQRFSDVQVVREKSGPQNLVTEVDFASQKIIQRYLLEHSSEIGICSSQLGFIGEEELGTEGEWKAIIDPIDGTTNYISGIPYFAVSIALSHLGQIRCGATYDPMSDTLYSAEQGKGAFVTSAGIQKRLLLTTKPLQECVLNTHISSKAEVRSQQLRILNMLIPAVRCVRTWGSGTLELAQLCENRTNIVLYGKCGIWDIAVATLLIQEAGGVISDWQGKPLELDYQSHDKTYQVLACHPAHHAEIVQTIQVAL